MSKNLPKEVVAILMVVAGILGVVVGAGICGVQSAQAIHTEKHGCEYVEKAECKQVWIKKGE